MKKAVLFSAMMCIASLLFSQDTTHRKPQTKIEQMAAKEGVVIKKEFQNLGSFSGVTVDLLTVSEVNSSQDVTLRGVRFSTTNSLGETSSYIDPDEINGVIKFVEFARQLGNVPENYTEYVYTSKGDFKADVFVSTGAFSGKKDWSLVVYGDKYYSSSARTISKKQMDDFYNALLKARDLLK